MKAIQFVHGDATAPPGEGARIIVHVCNDVGAWGKGFVMALSRRWPEPAREFKEWYRNRAQNDFALGAVQFVPVGGDVWVANLVGQKGLYAARGVPPIRYEAVAAGLAEVARKAKELGASVHMPRIGCGLAGGQWEQIEPLIQSALSEQDVEVTVYDYP